MPRSKLTKEMCLLHIDLPLMRASEQLGVNVSTLINAEKRFDIRFPRAGRGGNGRFIEKACMNEELRVQIPEEHMIEVERLARDEVVSPNHIAKLLIIEALKARKEPQA